MTNKKTPGCYRLLHTADWHLGKMLNDQRVRLGGPLGDGFVDVQKELAGVENCVPESRQGAVHRRPPTLPHAAGRGRLCGWRGAGRWRGF